MTKSKTLILSVLAFLCLFSCSKEIEDNNYGSDATINHRSSDCKVSYSFNVNKKTQLQAYGKPLEDFCQVDLFSITPSSNVTKQYDMCYNKSGNSCLQITNLSNDKAVGKGTEKANPDDIKTMSLCNGQATMTTVRGETETVTTEMDNSFFESFLQGIIYTQEQRDSIVTQSIQDAEQNGIRTQVTDKTITLTEVNEDGTTTITYIDRENNIPLYTETKDANGEVVSRSTFKYICVGGYIVPDIIINVDVKETAACLDKYTVKTTEQFTDHSINL